MKLWPGMVLATISVVSAAACFDVDDRPATNGQADRSMSDTTGRVCTWCSDGSCSFECDPPGHACGTNQNWNFDYRESVYLCQYEDQTNAPNKLCECNAIVCDADEDCLSDGVICAAQRCIFPCETSDDCYQGAPCEAGACIL